MFCCPSQIMLSKYYRIGDCDGLARKTPTNSNLVVFETNDLVRKNPINVACSFVMSTLVYMFYFCDVNVVPPQDQKSQRTSQLY